MSRSPSQRTDSCGSLFGGSDGIAGFAHLDDPLAGITDATQFEAQSKDAFGAFDVLPAPEPLPMPELLPMSEPPRQVPSTTGRPAETVPSHVVPGGSLDNVMEEVSRPAVSLETATYNPLASSFTNLPPDIIADLLALEQHQPQYSGLAYQPIPSSAYQTQYLPPLQYRPQHMPPPQYQTQLLPPLQYQPQSLRQWQYQAHPLPLPQYQTPLMPSLPNQAPQWQWYTPERPSATRRCPPPDTKIEKSPSKNGRPGYYPFEAYDWYEPLPARLDFGSITYRKGEQGRPTGELAYQFPLKRRQFMEYFQGCLAQGVDLCLWIQRVPTRHKNRFLHRHASHKCRFEDCPRTHRTLLRGDFQVSLDENSKRTGRDLDPFHVAGYVHLFCLEKAIDFPAFVRRYPNRIRLDKRDFTQEEVNPMSFLRDGPSQDLSPAFAKWRNTYVRDGTPREVPCNPNKDFLSCWLTSWCIDKMSTGRAALRRRRGGNHLGVHLGNLEASETLKENQMMQRKQERKEQAMRRRQGSSSSELSPPPPTSRPLSSFPLPGLSRPEPAAPASGPLSSSPFQGRSRLDPAAPALTLGSPYPSEVIFLEHPDEPSLSEMYPEFADPLQPTFEDFSTYDGTAPAAGTDPAASNDRELEAGYREHIEQSHHLRDTPSRRHSYRQHSQQSQDGNWPQQPGTAGPEGGGMPGAGLSSQDQVVGQNITPPEATRGALPGSPDLAPKSRKRDRAAVRSEDEDCALAGGLKKLEAILGKFQQEGEIDPKKRRSRSH